MVPNKEHIWNCTLCGQPFQIPDKDEIQFQGSQKKSFFDWNHQPHNTSTSNTESDEFSFKQLLKWSVIISIIIVFLVQMCSEPDPNNTPETNQYSTSVIIGVKDYLRQTLKDPDSYQEIEWSQIGTNSSNQLYVRHKYRAKNSFGGYVVEEKIFYLDKSGNVLYCEDY